MALTAYTADELFRCLVNRSDFLSLGVLNNEKFERFKVEGPYPVNMINVPYI